MSSAGTNDPKDVQVKTTMSSQPSGKDEPSSPEKTELPPPPVKPPAEKFADREAIKKIIRGDDYMLERFSAFIEENQDKLPGDLFEVIRGRIGK
jgi:hypothetical protein